MRRLIINLERSECAFCTEICYSINNFVHHGKDPTHPSPRGSSYLRQKNSTKDWGFLPVDAINGLIMLWTIRHICPSGAHFF